jgi:hypothetical protein
MAGGFSIASFNLRNFNYDARIGGGHDLPFKKAKTGRLCEIIRDGGYHVIALQEVQTPETVASIVSQLNGGNPSGRYSYVHCHTFYETISRDRFKSHTKNQTRGELAFIYDSESVELFRDYAAYKSVNDRLWLALDYFITGAITVLATALAASVFPRNARNQEDDEDEPVRENDERNKRKQAEAGVKTVGAIGVAGAGCKAHQFLKWQLKRMRPPFVAFFCRKVGGIVDESRQLRLINVHSQFGRTKGDKFSTSSKIREKESEYVLREAFQIVKSEQTGNTSLVLTMALGDFNLSRKALQKIVDGINAMPMRSDPMQIGVAEPTTVTVINRDAVKNGEERQFGYVNDYDHFAFDMDVWSPNDAKRAFGHDNKKFCVFEGRERREISDHLPVEITTSLF